MAVDDKVPPVPVTTDVIIPSTPEANKVLRGQKFTNTWNQWFIAVKAKIDVINASIVALSQFSGVGFITRRTDGTYVSRTIAGTSGNVSVANGDGAAGNPTIDLVSTGVTTGTYGDATHVGQFTVDAKGRLTNATNVTITGSGGSGVPSVNGITTAVTIASGTGISVGTAGSTITITNTGSSGTSVPIADGFVDPTTATGDLIIRDASTVTAITVGFIGDSITAGTLVTTAPSIPCATALSRSTVVVTSSNSGVSGSYTGDWISGSSNLVAAKSAFAAAGVHLVHIMLGTNDAKSGTATTQSQYRTNILSLCDDLINSGYIPIVSYPPYLSATTGVFDPASPGRVLSYLSVIDSVIDNYHLFQGDITAYAYFLANPSELQADGVHPTQAGSDHLAGFWATAMGKLVNGITNRSALKRATLGPGLTYASGVIDAPGGSLGLQETVRAQFNLPIIGTQRYLAIPRRLRIDGWEVLADVSGSLVLDVWSDLYVNYPPNSSKSICASAKPTLSSSIKGRDSTLTGWTTNLPDDTALIINVDSVTTITNFEFVLYCTKVAPPSLVTTWSPTDKETNFILSGGNLIITRTSGGVWGGIRGTISHDAATANHYFETVGTGSNQQMVGVSNVSAPVSTGNYLGIDANGWGHYANPGTKINSNAQVAYGSTWGPGDRLGVLLKNGKLYFRLNGTWMNSADPIAETGYAYSGLVGNLFPAYAMFTTSDTCTGYFSSATIVGSLPAGTSPWGA